MLTAPTEEAARAERFEKLTTGAPRVPDRSSRPSSVSPVKPASAPGLRFRKASRPDSNPVFKSRRATPAAAPLAVRLTALGSAFRLSGNAVPPSSSRPVMWARGARRPPIKSPLRLKRPIPGAPTSDPRSRRCTSSEARASSDGRAVIKPLRPRLCSSRTTEPSGALAWARPPFAPNSVACRPPLPVTVRLTGLPATCPDAARRPLKPCGSKVKPPETRPLTPATVKLPPGSSDRRAVIPSRAFQAASRPRPTPEANAPTLNSGTASEPLAPKVAVTSCPARLPLRRPVKLRLGVTFPPAISCPVRPKASRTTKSLTCKPAESKRAAPRHAPPATAPENTPARRPPVKRASPEATNGTPATELKSRLESARLKFPSGPLTFSDPAPAWKPPDTLPAFKATTPERGWLKTLPPAVTVNGDGHSPLAFKRASAKLPTKLTRGQTLPATWPAPNPVSTLASNLTSPATALALPETPRP